MLKLTLIARSYFILQQYYWMTVATSICHVTIEPGHPYIYLSILFKMIFFFSSCRYCVCSTSEPGHHQWYWWLYGAQGKIKKGSGMECKVEISWKQLDFWRDSELTAHAKPEWASKDHPSSKTNHFSIPSLQCTLSFSVWAGVISLLTDLAARCKQH